MNAERARDPHAGGRVLTAGADPATARLAGILVHGRGGSADDMLALAAAFALSDVAWLAPEAEASSWYPHSFLAPIADNEPWLSSAIRRLGSIRDSLGERGVPPARIALIGFSQGACLALEFAARHAARWAAVAGLSGGLIGPGGTPRDYAGDFNRTPVFLGVSDIDPHIPIARVHETAEVFRRMGAEVDERIYPRMGHTVNDDEVAAVRALLM